MEVDHCRGFVGDLMKRDNYYIESLAPNEDINELVYALRNDMDKYAETLISYVRAKDIAIAVTMCKIVLSNINKQMKI